MQSIRIRQLLIISPSLTEQRTGSNNSRMVVSVFFFSFQLRSVRDTLGGTTPGVFRFTLYADRPLYYRYRHHRSAVLT